MTTLLLLLACGAAPTDLQGAVADAAPAEAAPAEAAPSDEAPAMAGADAPETTARRAKAGKRGKNPGRPAPDRDADDADDAPITIDAPRSGGAVSTTIEVSGTAMVNEGQLTVEVNQRGQVLATSSPRADVGAPERGKWSATLQLPADARGDATLRAFSQSAKDGSPENEVTISVTIK